MTASTGEVPGRIFMSYRREETAYSAGWLFDRLVGHFGRPAGGLRPLEGLRLLDVGCGGGLISEPLARLAAAHRLGGCCSW